MEHLRLSLHLRLVEMCLSVLWLLNSYCMLSKTKQKLDFGLNVTYPCLLYFILLSAILFLVSANIIFNFSL